jgi:hypothetical protein
LDVQATDVWRRSPFYNMLQTGETLLRRRLSSDTQHQFSMLLDWRADGMTDYVAIITRFAAEGVIGEMDAVYSSRGTSASSTAPATASSNPTKTFPLNGGLGNNPSNRDAYIRYNLSR